MAYPDVQLEIVAEDRRVDPVEDGYDLVIRVDPTAEQLLVGRPFLRDERLIVASPEVGRPVRPKSGDTEDIAAGRLVAWGKQEGPPVEIWALHSSRRLVGAKVRAFIEVLEQAFPKKGFLPSA